MTSQNAFWTRSDIVLGKAAKDTQTGKRKSDKRQRTKIVALRLLPAEYEALLTAAHTAQVSLSELIRSSALHHTNQPNMDGEDRHGRP